MAALLLTVTVGLMLAAWHAYQCKMQATALLFLLLVAAGAHQLGLPDILLGSC